MENERIILHSDMNSFYASVELMLDPSLRGRPMAVGGSAEDRHGIILAKTEEAKRKGVKTGMSNYEAKNLCPELIICPPQYEEYVKYSKAAREIYARYTDLIEPFGMDEAWLDLSGSNRGRSGPELAEEIRNTIKSELGLTVSIGVSWNKIFAKLGSDMKKPDAVTVIDREHFREKIWPLSVSELLYAGHATQRKLRNVGIYTIGDLALSDPALIRNLLGVNGIMLRTFARGEDSSRVMHKDTVIPPLSISHGVTLSADLTRREEVYRVLLSLSTGISHRLRKAGCLAGNLRIYIRDSGLSFCECQGPLSQMTRSFEDISKASRQLFLKKYPGEFRVRQLTIAVFSLCPETSPVQFSFCQDQDYVKRRDRAETAFEEIRSRFGNRSVMPASLLLENRIPKDKRHLVKMPPLMYQ